MHLSPYVVVLIFVFLSAQRVSVLLRIEMGGVASAWNTYSTVSPPVSSSHSVRCSFADEPICV